MYKNISFRPRLGGIPLWFTWIVVTMLSGAVTTMLVWFLGMLGGIFHFFGEPSLANLLISLVLGLIDGFLSGNFQKLVLSNRLPRAGRWVLVTCLGMMLGWCLLPIIPLTDLSVLGDDFYIFLYVIAITRITASFFQWWLIGRDAGAYLWIVTSLVGWSVADLIAFALIRDSGLTPWSIVLLAGLTGSMITAVAAVWFFDRSKQRVGKTVGVISLATILLITGWITVELGFSQQIRSLRGHTGFLTSVVFSPDGSLLASASKEGNVMLWDVTPGRVVRVIDVNKVDLPGSMQSGNDVEQVLFSPDGSMLVTASDDGYFKVWKVANGLKLFENRSLSRRECVVFSSNSLLLAVLGGDYPNYNIGLWDLHKRKQLQTFELPNNASVDALAFTNGNQIAWLEYSEGTLGWKLEDGTNLTNLSDPWQASACGTIAFYPNGRFLATGGGDTWKINERAVMIWDLNQGTPGRTLSGPGVTALALSPDGQILAIGRSSEHSLLLWDVVNWEQIGQLRGGKNVSTIAFSPDGKFLATGSLDGVVRLWKLPEVR